MKMLGLIQNDRTRACVAILLVILLLFANVMILTHAAENTASTNVISTISALDSATMLLGSMGVIKSDEGGKYTLRKDAPQTHIEIQESSVEDLET